MSNLKILSISLFFLLIGYVNSEPCNKVERAIKEFWGFGVTLLVEIEIINFTSKYI